MSHKGTHLSAEVRAKISASERGKRVSSETRARISLAGLGKKNSLGTKRSAETRARMSVCKIGVLLTAVHCARIAEGVRQAHGNSTGHRSESGYPDEFFSTRLLIFKRDGYRCRICRARQKLNAHHLNYDKTDNRQENLVTLCGTCHLSHHGRRFWPIELGRALSCLAA